MFKKLMIITHNPDKITRKQSFPGYENAGNASHSRITCRAYMLIAGMIMCAFILLNASAVVRADDFSYDTWLAAEKVKYPAGKYWNHQGMSVDNSEGYTDKPCSLHSVSGIHISGVDGCTCNHFTDPGIGNAVQAPLVWHYKATQCMGFANKLGYDMFGTTTWKQTTDSNYKEDIRVGDILRINGHSSFVISKTADYKVTVAECNYTSKNNGCLIAWGRVIDLNNISNYEYYERAQNYDAVVNGTITPSSASGSDGDTSAKQDSTEADSTEQESFTGWKKTADGAHYQYYKNGKLLKSQWLTLSKKKYYLDNNGYRVTGLNTIKKNHYYFNNSGVLQKKKWVTVSGKTYYIGSGGYALKSQWLYKGSVLVYMKSDCTMAKNELVSIDGSTYYFNSKGKRSKGFKKYKGNYYYCSSYGIIYKKRWITKGGKKYYVQKSGVRVQNKLVKIGKYKYYFNNKGVLQKNTDVEYDEKIYHADSNGRCKFVEYANASDENTETDVTNTGLPND